MAVLRPETPTQLHGEVRPVEVCRQVSPFPLYQWEWDGVLTDLDMLGLELLVLFTGSRHTVYICEKVEQDSTDDSFEVFGVKG